VGGRKLYANKESVREFTEERGLKGFSKDNI